MHCAVLADFSRCLHVRKRRCSPPSDLGNQRPKPRAVRGKQHTPRRREKLVDGKRTVKFIWRGRPPLEEFYAKTEEFEENLGRLISAETEWNCSVFLPVRV